MPKNKNQRTRAHVRHPHKIYGLPHNFVPQEHGLNFKCIVLLVIICLSAKRDSVHLCNNIQSIHVIALLAPFTF